MSNGCAICGYPLKNLFSLDSQSSLTSIGVSLPITTEVYLCEGCGMTTSKGIEDLTGYYADQYKVHLGHPEEDKLYEVRNGEPIFRTQRQIEILDELGISLDGRVVLDYGCGKSNMGRALVNKFPTLDLYLFDVSDDYRHFWDFVGNQDEKTATFSAPINWLKKFDIIASWFSLEHILDINACFQAWSNLLTDSGLVIGMVPDMGFNPADFVCVDHVNHFSIESLSLLARKHDFMLEAANSEIYPGALFFVLQKSAGNTLDTLLTQKEKKRVQQWCSQVQELSDFWTLFHSRVKSVSNIVSDSFYIYGAGFYGKFILNCIQDKSRVRGFIDKNPFLVGREIDGIPVVAPTDVTLADVLVGLNPRAARAILSEAGDLDDVNLFFLDDQTPVKVSA